MDYISRSLLLFKLWIPRWEETEGYGGVIYPILLRHDWLFYSLYLLLLDSKMFTGLSVFLGSPQKMQPSLVSIV